MKEIGKNEGLKSVKHLPFLHVKKVDVYDERERKMESMFFIMTENNLKIISFIDNSSLLS